MRAQLWIFAVLLFFSASDLVSQPQLTEDLVSALAASKTSEERTRLLDQNQALITVELQQKLVEKGRSLSLQGDFERALLLRLRVSHCLEIHFPEGFIGHLMERGLRIFCQRKVNQIFMCSPLMVRRPAV